MGREIVYCEICGDRILEWEFDEGRAVNWENKTFCFKCKTTALEKLGKDAFQQAVLTPQGGTALPPAPAKPAAPTPSPAPSPRPTGRRRRRGRRLGMGASGGSSGGSSTRFSRRRGGGSRGGDDDEEGGRRTDPRLQKKKANWIPWAIGGGVVLLIIIIIIASSSKKKQPPRPGQRSSLDQPAAAMTVANSYDSAHRQLRLLHLQPGAGDPDART